MDGMTGLSPEVAKKNIETFYGEYSAAEGHLFETFQVLFMGLKDLWASPKAAEFANTYTPRINDVLSESRSGVCTVVKNAVRAYNTVSRSHGGGTMDTDFLWETPFKGDYKLLESKDGIVGMNVMQVRLLLDEFNNNISDLVMSRFNELPWDIALYDPNGEQKAAYTSSIKNILDHITNVVVDIRNDLNGYMETEENTILLAKQQSTETMNA